jgi:hypothetical protein
MFGLRTEYGMVVTEKIEEKIGLAVKSEIPSSVRNPLISASTSQK